MFGLCLFVSINLCGHLLIPISIHLSHFFLFRFFFFFRFKQADCHWQEKCSQAPSRNAICRHGNETTGRQRRSFELSRLEKPGFATFSFYQISDRRGSFTSHLQSDVPHSSSFSFAVKPTVIDVGIYVNSIGPVSSIDMVSPSAPSHYSSLRSCSLCPRVKARGNAGGRTRGSTWIKQMS